jgi:hypothetical protein
MKEKLQNIYKLDKYLPKPIDDSAFSRQEIRHHVPHKLTVIGDTGERTAIDIKRIFDSIEEGYPEVGKVEITGNAGVGKSTIHAIIAYFWAIGELFEEKFDYVFKVKLKVLINDDWQNLYDRSDIREFPLACFIHYALDVSTEDSISLDEIKTLLSDPNARDKHYYYLIILRM